MTRSKTQPPVRTLDRLEPGLERWLAAAEADADRRGLPELKPLQRGLAVSTAALREADWNERADGSPVTTGPDSDTAA